MNLREQYNELVERSKRWTLLESCGWLLGWEEQTYMPAGGVEHRGNQLASLAGVVHEQRTHPRVGELLGNLEASDFCANSESVEAVNLREWRRDYDRAVRMPQDLVEELARTTTLAQRQWVEARQKANYRQFEPWLGRVIELKRRQADAIGYTSHRYDALLDEYEPECRAGALAELFGRLRGPLVELVQELKGAKRRLDRSIVEREFPIDRQRFLGESAAAAIGFDFAAGRLDVTAHPFCSSIGPGDCRITTRYNPHFFNDAFFSTLHEAGHGMYEQGLPVEHFGTPMGQATSLGVHESQSRLWENAVGRSRSFWEHFFPRVRQAFPSPLAGVTAADFHRAVNSVQPSLIRVDADEVTYNLHVMIRFELELALLSGDLPVAEVPAAWNEKYRSYLAVVPPDDAKGCLQDIHWASGLVGYFPTYALGNLYAAQLFRRAKSDLGGLDESFRRGDFAPLVEWLRSKIHRHGRRFVPSRLIAEATGEPPSHEPLLESLRSKYHELYEL